VQKVTLNMFSFSIPLANVEHLKTTLSWPELVELLPQLRKTT
jgi:hypothetical protein